ncbi:MAG: aminotransferase class V-fold PLP-dependent enzyme [Thermodesulfobacteriota bacterium]
MRPVYLDHNATTPVDPAVREAMLPYLGERFGNPSSAHRLGQEARAAVEAAREQVAALLAARPSRLVFTGGGSEANNTAILAAALSRPERRHLVSSAVEHRSVLAPLEHLRRQGFEVELLPVAADGGLDPDLLASRLRPDTGLVSLMAAQNETGVLWPVAELAALVRSRGILFHTDAVQLAGKEAIDLGTWPVDYLSLAAHKLGGPKGVGALFVRRGAPYAPLVRGGGQEEGRRAGTENVPGLVGFGRAAELARARLAGFRPRLAALRDALETAVLAAIPGVRVNGAGQPRLANTSNLGFEHASGVVMVQELDERGFAVSAQAACLSGDLDPSPVLAAMAVPESYRHGSLRLSFGHGSTREELDRFLAVLPGVVAAARRGAAP